MMELKIDLCSQQCCEELPMAHYTIVEDNGDPDVCFHIIPNKDKDEIILDLSGVKDLIDVLKMFLNRYGR